MATDYLHLRTYGARIRTVRMLKYDQGIRAGNTKLSKKAFSAAMKSSEAQSVRKEAIGKFTSDLDDDPHRRRNRGGAMGPTTGTIKLW